MLWKFKASVWNLSNQQPEDKIGPVDFSNCYVLFYDIKLYEIMLFINCKRLYWVYCNYMPYTACKVFK